jgi:glucarate dehydratase
MKITDIKITPVTVPMVAPLRWSMGVETGTTRGIIQVFTDEGIIGIGETYGGNAVEHAIEIAKPFLIGLDPLETGVLMHRLNVFCISYESAVPPVVRAGIEMACLDAAGKALHKPIHSLLGGKVRDRIETAAYLFYRYATEDKKIPPVTTANDMVRHAENLMKTHGFRAIKLKGGVFRPEEEIKALEKLRARFPDAPLRWDPNAAWSVETSICTLRRLQKAGVELEYLEDPTWNLEGCSQVRKSIDDIPFATNMCLVAFEQLAPGIRMRTAVCFLGRSKVAFMFKPVRRERGSLQAEAVPMAARVNLHKRFGSFCISCVGHRPYSGFDATTPGIAAVIIGCRNRMRPSIHDQQLNINLRGHE